MSVLKVQITDPVPPATGALQVDGGPLRASETNVVPAGSTSVSSTVVAGSGPAFATVMTYVMSSPATTDAGPLLTTETSTSVTMTLHVAASFSSVGSLSAVTIAVFVYVVPDSVSAGTAVVSVKTASAPAASVAAVQVIVPPAPTAGVVQFNVGPLSWTSDTNCRSPGMVSCSVTFSASPGPPFPSAIVNANVVPGPTAAGPFFSIERSACATPGVVVEATPMLFSSFGSNVSLVNVTTFVNVVPGGVVGGMLKTKVKSIDAPAASDGSEQAIVPESPGSGVVQTACVPPFSVADTNVIPAGTSSTIVTFAAGSGPRFVIVTEYATLSPGAASAGPLFTAVRSAPCAASCGAASAATKKRRARVRRSVGIVRPFYARRLQYATSN